MSLNAHGDTAVVLAPRIWGASTPAASLWYSHPSFWMRVPQPCLQVFKFSNLGMNVLGDAAVVLAPKILSVRALQSNLNLSVEDLLPGTGSVRYPWGGGRWVNR